MKDIFDIIKILRPIEAATIEHCSQKHVITSIIIYIVSILQKNIVDCDSTQVLGIQLKAAILVQCEKCFSAVESVALLGMATILDPPFKNISRMQ